MNRLFSRAVGTALLGLAATWLAACGGGGSDSGASSDDDQQVAAITASAAVITQGTHYSQTYTSSLTATTRAGAPASLDSRYLSGDGASGVYQLKALSPGVYELTAAETFTGAGIPVAVAGTSLDLYSGLYYAAPGQPRIEVRVPVRLSCDQPAYRNTDRCTGATAPPGSDTAGTPPTPTPPPSGTAPAPRAFVNWNGNDNGDVVKDANDESFKFFADSRCLYSVQRDQETSNYCLAAGSASGSFAGRAISVVSARSTTGGCIAVLADRSTGRLIDIFTGGDGRQNFNVTSLTAPSC